MNKDAFSQFIELIELDEKILIIDNAFSKTSLAIAEKEDQYKKNEENEQLSHRMILTAKKEVDQQELIMRELEEEEKDKKEKLENAHYKDYTALQEELNHIHSKLQEQEQIVLNAWSHVDNVETKSVSTHEQYEKNKKEITEKIKDLTEKNKQLETEKESLLQERPIKEKAVVEDWLNKYAYMKGQVPDPVVPITQKSCSSCFHQLTAHDLSCARNKSLMQCKGCYRLLYLPEAIEDNDSE